MQVFRDEDGDGVIVTGDAGELFCRIEDIDGWPSVAIFSAGRLVAGLQGTDDGQAVVWQIGPGEVPGVGYVITEAGPIAVDCENLLRVRPDPLAASNN